MSVRWLRLPARKIGLRGDSHGGGDGNVDAWLDVIHGLAQRRAAEREQLAPRGAEARARLSRLQ